VNDIAADLPLKVLVLSDNTSVKRRVNQTGL